MRLITHLFILACFLLDLSAQIDISQSEILNPDCCGTGMQNVQFADLNNDGFMDMIVVGTFVIETHLGDQEGNFTFHSATNSLSNGYKEPQVIDMNGDALPDLVYGISYSLYWHENLGDGILGDQETLGLAAGQPSIYLSDFNDDGSQDVFWKLSNGFDLDQDGYLFLNDGAADLSTRISVSFDNGKLIDFLKLDVNNDGQKEIIGVFENSLEVFSYSNIDSSFLNTETLLTFNTPCTNLAFGHFNNDDLIDFVAIQGELLTPIELNYFEHSDNGFSSPQSLGLLSNMDEIRTLEDINGNGRADIQLGHNGQNSVLNAVSSFAYLNLADGVFKKLESFSNENLHFKNLDQDDFVEAYYVGGDFETNHLVYRLDLNEYTPMVQFEYEGCGIYSFCNLSFPLVNATSITWDFGDGTSSTDFYVEDKTFDNTGIYNISLTICEGLDCYSHSEELEVNQIVNYSIPYSAVVGEPVVFSNNSQSLVNQSWIINDDIVYLDQTVTHTFSEVGVYTVELLLTDPTVVDCTHQIIQEIIVEESSGSDALEIKPLIFSVANEIMISLKETDKFNNALLYNIDGKLLAQHKVNGNEGQIKFSNLDEAWYLVLLSSSDGIFSEKILVY